MAHQWDVLTANNEFLTFTTVGDDRVRPEHARLDGLTLSISSSVWKRLWPPLDWGCRCHVVPGIRAKASDDITAGKMVKDTVTNPLFDFNSGISKTIYKDDHPYFQSAGKTSELDAQKNYGLKSVAKLYDDHEFPKRNDSISEDDYQNWWRRQPKLKGTDDIVITDKTGTNILFDSVNTPGNTAKSNHFKDHILRKTSEKRWQYGTNFPEILADPDEIWSVRDAGKLIRYYIRYFEDAPYVVVANDVEGTLTAQSIYKLTEARATELRRGALLFTKK